MTGKSSLPDRPIREGQSRAESVVDMGDFVVSLKISSSSGAKLTIKSKDGLDVRSPQTLLDSYCNEILLDPVKFRRLGEPPEGRRRQAEILRKLVGLDFTKLEAQKSEAYVRRTAINRELDHARSRLAGYPDNPNAPEKEVPVRELMDKLSAIERRVREKLAQLDEKETALLNRLKIENDGRAGKAQALSENRRRAAEVSQQIETLKAQLAGLEKAIETGAAELQELKIHDIGSVQEQFRGLRKDYQAEADAESDPLRKQISEADDLNSAFRSQALRAEIQADIRAKEEMVSGLTATINQCERQKEEALADAKFPLTGLSFDESGILLNKFPLSQGSQAEQLKAVLSIGFALKPRIRVALVRDASILDDVSIREIEATCKEQEGQVWLECVRSDDPKALVIEDGAVKE